MARSWHDLPFAHWPVSLDQLSRVVPSPLTVDTFDDRAWLGVVAFRLSDVHLRGLPNAPGASAFPEVNLRTYVSLHGQPGVLFLSLHCPNRLAIALARPWFRLPCHYAGIQFDPWRLAPADADVRLNTLAQTFDLNLLQDQPLTSHCARHVDARIWPLQRVSRDASPTKTWSPARAG